MSAPAPGPAYKVGIVKQVLSGDTIVIRKQPQGGPPPEKILALSGITAPKLARQRTANSYISPQLNTGLPHSPPNFIKGVTVVLDPVRVGTLVETVIMHIYVLVPDDL